MPVYRIPRPHLFPDPREAEPSGLLGIGGDLDPDRVLLAYRMGIFPWYSEGQPITWFSPDPRLVLDPPDLIVPRSLGKRIRQGRYRITLDRAFGEVIRRCGAKSRPGQGGTWITREMLRAYDALHARGLAHSVEAWDGEQLVGGLYGVAVGSLFAGESMFADAPDASKVAFVHVVRQLQRWGCPRIDCQVHTEHLERFGAVEIPRDRYLEDLGRFSLGALPTGAWSFDPDFVCDGR
jgi:leucyl/phenylalanyl-tRNA--protein transferase